MDGILQRVDGRTIAQFIEEEINAPLGIKNYKIQILETELGEYNIAHMGMSESMYDVRK